MPSLQDTLATSRAGFGPAPERPPLPAPVTMPMKGNFTPNPSIRCPLPPFNVNVDTLRQFDQSEGASPRRRVIPLPVSSQVGGGSTTVNTTVVNNSSSGSSTTTTLTAKSVVVTTPILNAGQLSAQIVAMSKSYQLISITANSPCEMRLYGSAGSQASDASRLTDAPVAAEVFNNLVTDVVFDTPPYTWAWQNRVGVNTDTPQDTQAFISVVNLGVSPAVITLTIVFLPLES